MGGSTGNIQSLRENIKKELHGLYLDREIISITEILFAHRMGMQKHEIGLRKHEKPSLSDSIWISQAITRLRDHCPIQYITGRTEFLGLPMKIKPGILIPRPETEELVDWIMEENEINNPGILDVGTGSGCIALALKNFIPGSHVLATDISPEALSLAKENAELLSLEVKFMLHDILRGVTVPEAENLDLIVSNPPYIPESEINNIELNVIQYEPHPALFVPDEDPLLFYRKLAEFSSRHLTGSGWFFAELHENYSGKTAELFKQQGFNNITIRKDINGKDRMIKCRRP